jgi:hypothetical protein
VCALGKKADIYIYPQRPPIKAKIPCGNADVLRGSMRLAKHLKKPSNPHILKYYPPFHPATWLVSLPFLCLVVASLTHSNQVKVIKGKFPTEKECQNAYAAYALNIDARWFDVVSTHPGEMHEIIGASKSYRSGIIGAISRTVTMKTTEGKYRVVVWRGEGDDKPPLNKSKQCHGETKTDDNGFHTSNMPPNLSITTTTRLGSNPLSIINMARRNAKPAKSKVFPSLAKQYTRPRGSRLNNITELALTIANFKKSWELIHACLTSEDCTVAELKRAASMAMYYIQKFDKFVKTGSKPGRWTWRSSQLAYDLGLELKATTLLRAKDLFLTKIAEVEADEYRNPASATDQHEQGLGIHARLPRAILNREIRYLRVPICALDSRQHQSCYANVCFLAQPRSRQIELARTLMTRTIKSERSAISCTEANSTNSQDKSMPCTRLARIQLIHDLNTTYLVNICLLHSLGSYIDEDLSR